MRATFAHGLWSSPDSGKAEWLRSHGWEVLALDMRKHGWDQASQTRVVLEAIDDMGPFDVLIGSSFGGLATANAAAQRPELDLRLVLLAPAFGYLDLLRADLGEAGMAAWEASGAHTFHPPGWEEPVVMPWSFVEAAKPLAWPALPHPTAILHGSNDVVVPLAHSQKALQANPGATLTVVDDDHRLQASYADMKRLAEGLQNG